MNSLPLSRREFLRRSGSLGFLAFSGAAPSFLARSALANTPAPERDRTVLVIIQLAGGNDGLNTVIPFNDDRYYKLRPNLGIREGYHAIDDQLALHPSCGELYQLFEKGNLSLIQNVGYPNPNRSHFRSTEIWETASDSDRFLHSGWLGRYLDNTCAGSPEDDAARKSGEGPNAIHIGDMVPQSFLSDHPHQIFGLRARGRSGGRPSSADQSYETLLGAEHGEGAAGYLQHVMMNTLVTERRVEKIIGRTKPRSTTPAPP